MALCIVFIDKPGTYGLYMITFYITIHAQEVFVCRAMTTQQSVESGLSIIVSKNDVDLEIFHIDV